MRIKNFFSFLIFFLGLGFTLAWAKPETSEVPPSPPIRQRIKKKVPPYAPKKGLSLPSEPYVRQLPETDPAKITLQPGPPTGKDPTGEANRLLEKQLDKIPLLGPQQKAYEGSSPFSH